MDIKTTEVHESHLEVAISAANLEQLALAAVREKLKIAEGALGVTFSGVFKDATVTVVIDHVAVEAAKAAAPAEAPVAGSGSGIEIPASLRAAG